MTADAVLGTSLGTAGRYSHLDANVNDETRIRMRSHFDASSATLSAMPGRKAFSPDQRRRALRAYMRAAGHTKVLPWAKSAGVAEATIRNFLSGQSDSLSDRTYSLLAANDGVPVQRLIGTTEDPAADLQHVGDASLTVPVRSYVGAGDEVIVLQTNEPLYWVPPPPGLEDAEATEVRGRSMEPAYHDKDVLYHRRLEVDPMRFHREVVATQVRGGKRFIKLIERSARKGYFTLVSLNPLFPPIEDQKIDWVGPIEWMWRRRKRF